LIGKVNLGLKGKIVLDRFTPQTLDQILALIGGFASLIMTVFGVVIHTYHNFILEKKLIQTIYTREGEEMDEITGSPKE